MAGYRVSILNIPRTFKSPVLRLRHPRGNRAHEVGLIRTVLDAILHAWRRYLFFWLL
jgi:hypothetical protein